jgi:hypothetical protein
MFFIHVWYLITEWKYGWLHVTCMCIGWYKSFDSRGNVLNIECQVTFAPPCTYLSACIHIHTQYFCCLSIRIIQMMCDVVLCCVHMHVFLVGTLWPYMKFKLFSFPNYHLSKFTPVLLIFWLCVVVGSVWGIWCTGAVHWSHLATWLTHSWKTAGRYSLCYDFPGKLAEEANGQCCRSATSSGQG